VIANINGQNLRISFQMRKNEAQEKVWMHQQGFLLIESTALDNN
jgi:hypothetical protein